MITIDLPDGSSIDVDTDDEAVAIAAGQKYLQSLQAKPQTTAPTVEEPLTARAKRVLETAATSQTASDVARVGGAMARGVMGLPAMIGQAGAEAWNATTPAQAWLANTLGYGKGVTAGQLAIEPQNMPLNALYTTTTQRGEPTGGRLLEGGLGALTGAGGARAVAAAAPAAKAGLKNMASTLAERPGLQAVSGVTAAGGVEAAKEAGAGPVGQVAAGLAAGMAPAGLAAGGITAGRQLVGNGVSPEVAALAKRAKELGIDIPADRIVDSRPLNAAAESLNYIPFSGRAAVESNMESQLTRAASRLVGQDTPNMTAALRKADSELGAKFDDVLSNNSVTADSQFMSDLRDVYQSANRELGADGLKAITNQIDEIIAKSRGGVIDGQAAYNIKRTLDRIGRRTTPEAYHALELKRALMGALDRSLTPEKAKEFALTRQQYGNMIALEKIAKNGPEGDISVARLANMRNINNPALQELADIAARFIKPREGQHGAMQRVALGTVAAVSGGNALAGLGTGAALGRAANAGLKSEAAREFAIDPNSVSARQILGQGAAGTAQGVKGTAGESPALPALSGIPQLANVVKAGMTDRDVRIAIGQMPAKQQRIAFDWLARHGTAEQKAAFRQYANRSR